MQDPYQPKGRPQDISKGTFKEQNLLIVEKKKKFANNQSQHGAARHTLDEGMGGTAEEGVLSIPPEDAPKNCKSKWHNSSRKPHLICLDWQSAAGACAASPTTSSAAASAGKRRSLQRTSPISSSGLQSGSRTDVGSKSWPPPTRIPSQCSSRFTLASLPPSRSWPRAGSTQTWPRQCAKTSSFSSRSSFPSTCRAITRTWPS